MWIFGNADVGRKNVVLGIALFLALGVGVGVPLTVDFFGGSSLGTDYQTWKVVHGYAVFLSFINYFFGLTIDRWNLSRSQMELASWSFILAGLIGGVARPALVLFAAMDSLGIYASLGETVFLSLGTILVIAGQLRGAAQAGESPRRLRHEVRTYGPTH